MAGNVRVYPYAGDLYKLRTSEEMRHHALLAKENKIDVSFVHIMSPILCINASDFN